MAQQTIESDIPSITPEDLRDPNLARLNRILRLIARGTSGLANAGGAGVAGQTAPVASSGGVATTVVVNAVTDDELVAINDELVPSARQSLRNVRGDNLSVRMFQGNGDGIRISDAVMTATFNVLSSAAVSFVSKDVGKLVMVAGAGAAGADLITTISAASAGNAILNANAGTTVAGANAIYGTDNTAAFIEAFDRNGRLVLPVGIFLVSYQLPLLDKYGLSIHGHGDGTIIVPTVGVADHLFDLSGSNDIEMAHFQIDGRFFQNIDKRIIFGDGTTANATYGNIRIRQMSFANCRPIVLGLGASASKTAQDVTYEHNRFYNCGFGTFVANLIDVGSAGTKKRFDITHNRFVYITQPASSPGSAIFAGQGTNEDFDISHNRIVDAPSIGINISNRPAGTETTGLTGFTINSNRIRRPKWAGIALYGPSHTEVEGNTVINAGYAEDASPARRCAILISTRLTGAGPTEFGGSNVTIQGNTLVDDTGGTKMSCGIFETTISGLASEHTQCEIGPNMINGAGSTPISVGTKAAIITHDPTTTNWALGKAFLNARSNVQDNLQVQSSDGTHLFNEMTSKAAITAANFLLCHAFNASFDGANWVSGFDGVRNGFAVIGVHYGTTTLRIYVVPTSGGAAQTLSPATLETHLIAIVDTVGMILPALTASLPVRTDAAKRFTSGPIDLATEVTGVLPETEGGTGESSYTKGDLLVATGATTLVKLGVGADGEVLVADSAATEGVKWDAAGGGGEALEADASGAYTLTTSYADVPGVTVTATKDGTWLVRVSVSFAQNTSDTNLSAQLLLNASVQSNPISLFANDADVLCGFREWRLTSVVIGDVIKLQAKKNSGAGTSSLGAQTNIVAEWVA